LAEDILHDHHDKLDAVTLIPSGGGVYEVTYGGELIYSKKQTGQFPDPETIKQAVGAS
jgi:selenoprotein W-related protein